MGRALVLAETVAYNLLLEAHATPDACDAAETGAAAVALPAPMFIGEAHCSSYLTYRSAREVGGGSATAAAPVSAASHASGVTWASSSKL